MPFTSNDVKIPVVSPADHGNPTQDPLVTLWRVRGLPGYLYPTKAAAEGAAIQAFQSEGLLKNYARVSFVQAFVDTDDVTTHQPELPRMASYFGKVQVLEQDGGYCAPCIEIRPDYPNDDEIVSLTDELAKYAGRVVVVAIELKED